MLFFKTEWLSDRKYRTSNDFVDQDRTGSVEAHDRDRHFRPCREAVRPFAGPTQSVHKQSEEQKVDQHHDDKDDFVGTARGDGSENRENKIP